MDQHPGGWPFEGFTWERCHKSFYGGVYGHLTAAVNLLATMRIGVLDDGDDEEVWRRVAREEREVSNSTDSDQATITLLKQHRLVGDVFQTTLQING